MSGVWWFGGITTCMCSRVKGIRAKGLGVSETNVYLQNSNFWKERVTGNSGNVKLSQLFKIVMICGVN